MCGKPSVLSSLAKYLLLQSTLIFSAAALGLAGLYQLGHQNTDGSMPYCGLLFELSGLFALASVVTHLGCQYQLSGKQRWASSLVLGALYLSSYTVLSLNGKYHSSRSGLHRWNAIGLAIDDQSLWFAKGVFWQPFRNIKGRDTVQATMLGHFYSPLIFLDRAFLHHTIDWFDAKR